MNNYNSFACIAFSTSWGGAENYLLNMFRVFTRKGLRVRVYANQELIDLFSPYADIDVDWQSLGSFDLVSFAPVRFFQKRLRYRQMGKRLYALLKKNKEQIVNLHLEGALWVYWFATMKGKLDVTSVLTSHYWEVTHSLNTPRKNATIRKCIQSMDGYISLHADSYERLGKLRTQKQPIFQSSLFVDTQRFRIEAKQAYSMSYVARMRPTKRPMDAVQAMPAVLEALPEAHLYMAGDGPLLDDVKEEAKRLSVEHAITFHGHVADVAPIVNTTAVNLSLLNYDNYDSVATKEALAAGNILVTIDNEHAKKITENHLGELVPEGDIEALSQAIISVLSDEKLSQWQEKNREYILTNYDPNQLVQAYSEFIEQL